MLTNDTIKQQRKAERAVRRMDRGGELSQMWRLLTPWLLLAAALVLAPLAWFLTWLFEVQTFTAICVAVAGAVMLAVSIKLTKGRMTLSRWHELFNVAAPTGVVSWTVAFGPDEHVLIAAGVFGVASAIIWTRRHASSTVRELERRGNGAVGYGQATPAAWKEFVREHMPQVADSNMTVLADTPAVFAAGLDLGDGEVPSDVMTDQLIDKITKFAGGIRGGTTLQIGDYLDRIGVTVMRTDPLKRPFPWQGVVDPGISIREPIRGLGKYRDGADLTLHLPYVPNYRDGEDKPQSHMMLIGMSRAGKGEAGEAIDVNVMTRKDAAVVLCDAVKADQQLGVISRGAAYVLDNQNAIRAFFYKLVNATIPARAAFLGNPGRNRLGKISKEWEAGCGLTWLLVHVYEASALYNNQDMTKITERAASVGIEIVIEAQRGIHDRVDTTARSNAGDLIMFGVKDPDDAALVLPPELLDAGAAPWVWQNKRGGMCHTVLGHLTPARQAIPARFGRKAADGSDIAAILDEYLHLADPLDPITAATWGDPYAKFAAARAAEQGRVPRQHSFAPVPARVVQGAVLLDTRPAPAPAAPADEAEAGFDLDDPCDDEVPPDDEAERAELTRVAERVVGDMAIALDGHPEAGQVLNQAVDALETYGDDEAPDDAPPSDDPGRGQFELPDDPDEAHLQPIVSRDEALDIVLDILAEDVGEGETFRWSDLYDKIAARTRRGDSWVRKLRKPLLGWGCVQEADAYGLYVVIHTRRGDLDDYPE
jgi:hypothetical protein